MGVLMVWEHGGPRHSFRAPHTPAPQTPLGRKGITASSAVLPGASSGHPWAVPGHGAE